MNIYFIIGAAVAALGLLVWSHTSAYRAGRAAEQASIATKINEENENAGDAAEKWRADLRRCSDAGRLFDFEAGTCDQ